MLNIFPRSTCNQAFVWLMAVWAQYFSIVFKTPSLAKSAFREPYVELWVSLVVGLLLRFSEINNDRWWKKGTPSYRLSARSSICIPRWMPWFTYTFFHTHRDKICKSLFLCYSAERMMKPINKASRFSLLTQIKPHC